jgi:hypothetical protein
MENGGFCTNVREEEATEGGTERGELRVVVSLWSDSCRDLDIVFLVVGARLLALVLLVRRHIGCVK